MAREPGELLQIVLIIAITDIKALPREETVCQFCGVSYLIHHEIKKLEERVQQQRKEIEESKSR